MREGSFWNSGAEDRVKETVRICLGEGEKGKWGTGVRPPAVGGGPGAAAVAAKSQVGAEESFSYTILDALPEQGGKEGRKVWGALSTWAS